MLSEEFGFVMVRSFCACNSQLACFGSWKTISVHPNVSATLQWAHWNWLIFLFNLVARFVYCMPWDDGRSWHIHCRTGGTRRRQNMSKMCVKNVQSMVERNTTQWNAMYVELICSDWCSWCVPNWRHLQGLRFIIHRQKTFIRHHEIVRNFCECNSQFICFGSWQTMKLHPEHIFGLVDVSWEGKGRWNDLCLSQQVFSPVSQSTIQTSLYLSITLPLFFLRECKWCTSSCRICHCRCSRWDETVTTIHGNVNVLPVKDSRR
jgi:hypothetical protein